jgi:prepilin-type N-terminal cleavage/methylation domain-containing protein
MRRGFTLVELLVVIAVAALLLALAAPRFAGMLDSIQAEAAARRLAGALQLARATAVLRGRRTALEVQRGALALRLVDGRDSTLVWQVPGPAAESVALTGPSRPVVFAPTGLAFGVANATFQLSRGRASRQVVVSRLGRVRIAH